MKDNLKPVLIYRLGSLGDTVMALPCFHQIRRYFSESEITLLTNKPVMAKAAPLQAVLGRDRYFYDHILTYPMGTRDPLELSKLIIKIRKLKIHTVVNITALRSVSSDRRDLMFFKAAGIKNFIGFDQNPDDFHLSIDPATGKNEWEAHRLKRKITSLGTFSLDDSAFWDLRLTPQESKNAEEAIQSFADNQDIIIICTGTKILLNDWGSDNWKLLLHKLWEKIPDYKLIIIGVDEEFALAEELLNIWNGSGLNLCGKTSPRVSAAILRKAAIFVGHDSGPLHLAACVGTPCVGIFSCNNPPYQWYPKGDFNEILYPTTSCAIKRTKACASGKRCILFTSPDEVLSGVLRALNKSKVL